MVRNKTSGFTLIELMIAMVVAGIGISAVSWILLLNQRSWKEGNAKLELQRDTYLAMLKIEHELRPAKSSDMSDMDMSISSPPDPLLTIDYTTNDEKFFLSFSLEDNDDLLFRKYIYNTDTTEWDKLEELVMAKEITDANFGDSSISPTSKLVTVNFTLVRGNLESFITTSVKPRN